MSFIVHEDRCLGCGRWVKEGVERCDKCIAKAVVSMVASRLGLRDVRPADITEPWTL